VLGVPLDVHMPVKVLGAFMGAFCAGFFVLGFCIGTVLFLVRKRE